MAYLMIFSGLSWSDTRQEIDLSGSGWTATRDTQAGWQNEEIYLPGTPLSAIDVHPPTGGWSLLQSGVPVQVPGTAEEYFYKDLDLTKIKSARRPQSPLEGVTWWSRTIQIPEASGPRRFILRFGSVRLRAEVFLDHKLVGYDLVGDTPFAVDVTDAVHAGQTARIDVRVTNPGGCFDWTDTEQIKWGKHLLPDGRAFGGITGRVALQVLDSVYVDDLSILNRPDPRSVTAGIDLMNSTAGTSVRDLVVEVHDPASKDGPIFTQTLKGVSLPVGLSHQTLTFSLPQAKLWSLDSPKLYVCRVRLLDNGLETDATQTKFGLRWFALDGLGTNALPRLNGQRVFLRTAISWGYWPVTGLIPTPDMAEKQIETAKELGLNMLNFHRCIGSPVVLDAADRDGLLYFEEPGGYVTGGADPFAQALAREKFLRMARRDRSHPSLIIYNMINEQWTQFGADKNPDVFAVAKRDMRDAHAIDPSRLFIYSSAWDKNGNGVDEPQKLNMRPYDDTQYFHGWWDFHRAGGPMTYQETTYKDPTDHYGYTDNLGEIVYHGEEGAISSPPRLALIQQAVDRSGKVGWDGTTYLDWYGKFMHFMDDKHLHGDFGTLDDFTRMLSTVSFEHQGRKIEDTRICDANDGYAINGWEAEVFDNHSGVVDCYRNPKGDATLIAYYNQPLYIAVKLRHQFAEPGGKVLGDFYILNEKNLHGDFKLKYRVSDPSGKELLVGEKPVTIHGGDVFSELLAEGIDLPAAPGAGFCQVNATLTDAGGATVAKGHDQFLTVAVKETELPRNGAVFEAGHDVRDFLASQDNLTVPAFNEAVGPLDWLLVTRSPKDELRPPGPGDLEDVDGKLGAITTTFYDSGDLAHQVEQRHDQHALFNCPGGATPDSGVLQTENYGVRLEGQIVPPSSGAFQFALKNTHDASLYIADKLVLENKVPRGAGQKMVMLNLTQGTPVHFRIDYARGSGGDGNVSLLWLPPAQKQVDPVKLVERAKSGTTVILADHAEDWMDAVKQVTGVSYTGSFKVGNVWLGGQFFVRESDLFHGLPVNCSLNWPYQAVVDDHRIGLSVEGEELVAGCWQSTGCQLGTAVGIIPCGKGRIIFSTLNIIPKITANDPPSLVARRLLANFILYK